MLWIGVAAWLIALKVANESEGSRPVLLGLGVGAVFALEGWIGVVFFKAPFLPALVATPLYLLAGAALVAGFARVEGVLWGLVIVVAGTAVLAFAVPKLADRLGGRRGEGPGPSAALAAPATLTTAEARVLA